MGGAATLISFDRPNLIVVRDSKGMYGYYTGVSGGPTSFGDIEQYECTFLFMRVDGPDEVTVRSVNYRNHGAYAEGSIRIDGSSWQIQFSDNPRGCSGKYSLEEILVPPGGPGLNATVYAARGAHFNVVRKTKVVGIRWVDFDTTIHRRVKSEFRSTGQTLGVGTLVVVLRTIGAFSEVEYVDLNIGTKVRTWAPSKKLVNPFRNGHDKG